MRTLQEGDKLKSTLDEDKEIIVLGVCGKVIFTKTYNSEYDITRWLGEEEIENEHWKLTEPDWKPEECEKYYTPDPRDEDFYGKHNWINSKYGKECFKRGLCFKTKEEAIAKAKLMLNTK